MSISDPAVDDNSNQFSTPTTDLKREEVFISSVKCSTEGKKIILLSAAPFVLCTILAFGGCSRYG